MSLETEGTTEAIVLVKAAPQISQKHRETVCCAGVTLTGKWVRLYPVSFRILDDAQKFERWDRIRFKWRKPIDDPRPENLRIDQDSIDIIGELPPAERQNFLAPLEVTSLKPLTDAGLSLALLRPKNLQFLIEVKTPDELKEEKQRFLDLHNQPDLFNIKRLIPYEPSPYRFKYKYEIEDGEREGTCQDWEIEATFFRWSKKYGVEQTLEHMKQRFGVEYPERGVAFAMGTHSRYPDCWLINGLIRLDEIQQLILF